MNESMSLMVRVAGQSRPRDRSANGPPFFLAYGRRSHRVRGPAVLAPQEFHEFGPGNRVVLADGCERSSRFELNKGCCGCPRQRCARSTHGRAVCESARVRFYRASNQFFLDNTNRERASWLEILCARWISTRAALRRRPTTRATGIISAARSAGAASSRIRSDMFPGLNIARPRIICDNRLRCAG